MSQVRLFVHHLFSSFFSPTQLARALQSVPWYVRSLAQYRRMTREPLPFLSLWPCLLDRYDAGGTSKGEYFYQDFWAARKVFESRCPEHVDVGSRVDGFVAHCAVFTQVTYVDIRPIDTRVQSIRPLIGTLLDLPFPDRSVPSLSCLHVVEHIGLGRYGDPLDPEGSIKSMKELQRVLAPGGQLYFGLPIGRERVNFNALRVHSPLRVTEVLSELTLKAFAAIDERGDLIEPASIDEFVSRDYACGLFHFERPAQ